MYHPPGELIGHLRLAMVHGISVSALLILHQRHLVLNLPEFVQQFLDTVEISQHHPLTYEWS